MWGCSAVSLATQSLDTKVSQSVMLSLQPILLKPNQQSVPGLTLNPMLEVIAHLKWRKKETVYAKLSPDSTGNL